jgi:acyl dehydratase
VGRRLIDGLNRVRFLNPAIVGSNIRNRIFLSDVEEQKEGMILITTTHTIEIERQAKPACVAENVFTIVSTEMEDYHLM